MVLSSCHEDLAIERGVTLSLGEQIRLVFRVRGVGRLFSRELPACPANFKPAKPNGPDIRNTPQGNRTSYPEGPCTLPLWN